MLQRSLRQQPGRHHGVNALPAQLHAKRGIDPDERRRSALRPGDAAEFLQEIDLARVDVVAAAWRPPVGIMVLNPGPSEQDLLDQRPGLGQIRRGKTVQRFDKRLQLGIAGHGKVQRRQRTVAARLRQQHRLDVNRCGRSEDLALRAQGPGVDVVVQVMHVRDLAGHAGRQLERRDVRDEVFLDVAVVRGVVQGDGRNAVRRQGLEFTRLAYAVLVEILPDPQLRPVGIGRGDLAVAVAVMQAQLAEGGHLVVAVKLGDVVDPSVAIPVHGKLAVVRANPADTLGKAVRVNVEEHRAIVIDMAEVGSHPIAIEVKDERADVVHGPADPAKELA